MNATARYLINRFKEPSSWAGMGGFAALVGVTQPVYAAIALTGAGICGLLSFFLPESK